MGGVGWGSANAVEEAMGETKQETRTGAAGDAEALALSIREGALRAVVDAANLGLPDGEEVYVAKDGPRSPWHVEHVRAGGCLDCGGAGDGVTCHKHGGGCDCAGVVVECESCDGTGKAFDRDCSCPACATVADALMDEAAHG
jgi:hypothetical protein